MIQVETKATSPLRSKLDVLFVLAVEGEEVADEYGDASPGARAACETGDFCGRAKQVGVHYSEGKCPVRRVGLVGLGQRKKLSLEVIRRCMAKAMDKARELKAETIGFSFDAVNFGETPEVAAAITEAVILADYKFRRMKTVADRKKPGMRKARKAKAATKVIVFCKGKKVKAEVEVARVCAEAANECREIANLPGNYATPTYMAKRSKELGKKHGFSVKVLNEAAMKKEGMGALLGVSRGSREPAQLIIMEHKPKGTGKKKLEKICLVGKGLTFDAGGISLKPGERMWEMKFDKCGGCAVIGAMKAIAELNLPFHVYGVVPASENMPDGDAVKPGDVLTSLTGHTIEILNTDAEGRLILADALGYCHRLKPDVVIDLATLTGSCVVALASIRAGVMGDDGLCDDLIEAGEKTGERCWQLPLDDEFGEMLKTENADLKNIGGRWGGTSIAGHFLSNFVPPKSTWAHIDIAGPAWKTDNSDGRDYLGKGGSGFGTRLLIQLLRDRASKAK